MKKDNLEYLQIISFDENLYMVTMISDNGVITIKNIKTKEETTLIDSQDFIVVSGKLIKEYTEDLLLK